MRSDAAQKQISITYLVGVGLVLLAALGIGVAIRKSRFRSWEKHLAQAQKAVQPVDITKIRTAPKESEIQNIQEPLPIEDEEVEPEPLEPESDSPPTLQGADGQNPTEAQTEMAAVLLDLDQRSNEEDPAVKERRGREALALIGHDPGADAVWIEVINNPSVSANARSNLIEDLNEDGLAYRNLTWDDMPVIQYRIKLIEDLRPFAMDKTNADAFDEAYKDLVNMALTLLQ